MLPLDVGVCYKGVCYDKLLLVDSKSESDQILPLNHQVPNRENSSETGSVR